MMDDAVRAARPLVVDVLLTPAELANSRPMRPTDVAVVIDVIRATTTLTVLCDSGCAQVLVAGEIPAARAFAAAHPGAYLLAGEVGGLRPPGFDFGNSPVEVTAADLRGRSVVFCTTNGTRALHACLGAGAILAGSLRNAQAVCRAALSFVGMQSAAQPEPQPGSASAPLSSEIASEARVELLEEDTPRLMVICSGRLERPAVDDTFCAGVLVAHLERLASAAGYALRLRDGARLARQVATGTSVPVELLRASAAGQAVARVGLEDDLALCAAIDASQSVPGVVGANEAGLLIMERAVF